MRKYSRSLEVDVVGGLQQASDVGYVDLQARRVVERSLDFEADQVSGVDYGEIGCSGCAIGRGPGQHRSRIGPAREQEVDAARPRIRGG